MLLSMRTIVFSLQLHLNKESVLTDPACLVMWYMYMKIISNKFADGPLGPSALTLDKLDAVVTK